MDLLNKQQKTKFLTEVSNRIGCYYCWPTQSNKYSGKDLKGAQYPRTYDCSGLVTSSLYDATGIDRRAVWNAQRLMQNCAMVEVPEPGDLCFYGPSKGLVTHVMVYVGRTKLAKFEPGKVCYGSSGGDSRTTSPQIAQKSDAKVKGYKTVKYRSDFLGYGRLVTKDE